MDIGDLYQFVLVVVLIGMLLGVGIIVLDNFAASSGVTAPAAIAINATRAALSPIATTWLPLIVTIAVLAIVLKLVIGSFGAGQR
jgi:hypothetical protein